MKKIFTIYLFAFVLICLPLSAQIPQKISYQGVLTDNYNNPLNGQYNMKFRLYDTETGGSPLWNETQDTVRVTNGIFNVLLGENTSLSGVAFDVPYWLTIEVAGTLLSPRIELSSTAYSIRAQYVEEEVDPTWIGPANTTGDINRTGNVVIGTTSGTNSRLWVYTTETNDGIKINNDGYNQSLRIINGPNAHNALSITNNGNEYAIYINNSGNKDAVHIENTGNDNALEIRNFNGGRGLWVVNSGGDYAGYFGGSSADVVIEGNLDVGGTITKGGGTFMIDHPLDPENMILRHSFVESPDMMNIYNGNVTTGVDGFAAIKLPDYFEALNKDFRYQLTVIGQFAQAIVSDEIRNNRFTIQTDKPNIKVSWQVTGIRKDPWAEKNRIVVEEHKSPETQGFYLHPDVYGQPETRSIEWAKHPEFMKQLKEEAIQNEYGKE